MRKSLITTAVLGALAAPSFVFAADAAPAPDLTVAYNVGLYSQYIFRGLTQTNRDPALQGGVDLTHSSGFYLGAWASNISWLTDGNSSNNISGVKCAGGATCTESKYYKSGGSVELDLYGGYRYAFGDTGLGLDLGALQYYYSGKSDTTLDKANTTELYGSLSYKWLQAKISGVVSDSAWGNGKIQSATLKTRGNDDAKGTYYAELNANIPIGDLIGGGALAGISGIAHVARQEFPGDLSPMSYTDYKLGLQKTFSEGNLNGVNLGGYWTYADTKNYWTLDGRNIGDSTGTVYVQKTF